MRLALLLLVSILATLPSFSMLSAQSRIFPRFNNSWFLQSRRVNPSQQFRRSSNRGQRNLQRVIRGNRPQRFARQDEVVEQNAIDNPFDDQVIESLPSTQPTNGRVIDDQVLEHEIIEDPGVGRDFFVEERPVRQFSSRFGPPGIDLNAWYSDQFRVYANLLYMTRSRANSLALAANSAFNFMGGTQPSPVLSANQFDFDHELGFELGLRTRIGPASELDLRYLQLESLNSDAVNFTTPSGTLFYPVMLFGTLGSQHRANYDSELHSFEINFLSQRTENIRLGFGLRTIQLGEVLTIASSGMPATRRNSGQSQWSTENFLFGGQVFVEALLLQNDRFRIDAFLKSGLFGNAASASYARAGQPFGFQQLDRSTQLTEFENDSLANELGIRGTARMTRSWAVNTGLQILFLNGVALAPDQIPNSVADGTGAMIVQPARVDKGNMYFYGGFLGLEYRR